MARCLDKEPDKRSTIDELIDGFDRKVVAASPLPATANDASRGASRPAVIAIAGLVALAVLLYSLAGKSFFEKDARIKEKISIAVRLPAGMTDANGGPIMNEVSYVAFVLSVADGVIAGVNSLSRSSNVMPVAVTTTRVTYVGNDGVMISDDEHAVIIEANRDLIVEVINPKLVIGLHFLPGRLNTEPDQVLGLYPDADVFTQVLEWRRY